MDDRHMQDDGDLFEQIQSRIEKEMFRDPGDPAGEILTQKSPGRFKDTPPISDDSKVKIVVEVDVVDSETNDPDVDESFLEEVDFITPGAGEAPPDQKSPVSPTDVPDYTEPPSLPSLRPDEDISSASDELADVQEDDLFLGELIDREMVGAMKTHGSPVEEQGISPETELHETAKPAEEADRKEVLHTRTLAELYAEQGMYGKAKEILEDLLRESPNDETLRERLEAVKRQLAKREVEVSAAPMGKTVPENGGQKNERVIQRLEAWLAQVYAEKERRCSKSS